MRAKSVLPASVRSLSLSEKLKRLKQLAPEKHRGLVILVDFALEESWREQFHPGPRGGVVKPTDRATS